jgi:hypothetical protein
MTRQEARERYAQGGPLADEAVPAIVPMAPESAVSDGVQREPLGEANAGEADI